ncbi:hypothetical protein [Rhizobium tropici]|uniref:hypothetical protein n=1 Tax=Rhizobium tropici TaxID=398 RepID=UPI0011BD7B2B|nr:hypothetical protein [Rhizobium tropici]
MFRSFLLKVMEHRELARQWIKECCSTNPAGAQGLVFAMAVMDGKATTLYDEQYFIDALRLIPAN